MNGVLLFVIAGLGVLSIGLYMFLDATGILRLVRRSNQLSEKSQRIINVVGAIVGAIGSLIGLFILFVGLAAALA